MWYTLERKKFIQERKAEDYMQMSYTVKFIAGAFILFIIGIKLIYDAV